MNLENRMVIEQEAADKAEALNSFHVTRRSRKPSEAELAFYDAQTEAILALPEGASFEWEDFK